MTGDDGNPQCSRSLNKVAGVPPDFLSSHPRYPSADGIGPCSGGWLVSRRRCMNGAKQFAIVVGWASAEDAAMVASNRIS